MATTFFPHSSAATAPGGGDPRQLLLTRDSSVVSTTQNTIATSNFVIDTWGGGGAGQLYWWTNPLDAVTISGTITVNMRALESNAMANYTVGISILRYSPISGPSTIGTAPTGLTELGTSESARNFTITPTSTALAAGDRIRCDPFWYLAGGSSSSASGFTVTGFWAGPTSGASGDTFITFTETITEQIAATDEEFPYIGGGYFPMIKDELKNVWRPRRPKLWKPDLWLPPKPSLVYN
jgi:hypothetical protein